MSNKNVVLVGYMGCGKTTVGKNLARICSYQFMDTDEYIEKKQNRSISEIFATDGETAFRDMETECIRELIAMNHDEKGMVLSTGGGMAVRPENRELLKELGLVVFLRTKPETVYNRIQGDTTRPLLQCEDPLCKIREMLVARTPAYIDAADEVIDVDELKQQEIAELIKKML